MEGRISREELIRPRSSISEGENDSAFSPRESYRSASPARSAGRNPGRSVRSSRRQYNGRTQKSAVSAGMDLLVVQVLASGVLLLIVMFLAIVDSDVTKTAAAKLEEAFSKSTTLEELKDGFYVARDKLMGGKDTVLEIFGGEIEESGSPQISEQSEVADESELVDVADTEALVGERQNSADNGVLIDEETLKQLIEASGDDPKN